MITMTIILIIPVLIFRAPLIPFGQHGVTNLEIVCVKGLFSVHTYTLTHTQNTHSHTHKDKKGHLHSHTHTLHLVV